MRICKECGNSKTEYQFYENRRTCITCHNRRNYYHKRYRMPKGISLSMLPDPIMTERQIAKRLGISRQRVQQILHSALHKLRENLLC